MNAYITADRTNEKRTAATANNSRPNAGETSSTKSLTV